MHGGVPGYGDACRTGYLGSIGEPTAVDVALFEVGHVGEADASAVDAEEEEVTSKGQGFGMGEVGITHTAQVLFCKNLSLSLGWHGCLDAFQQSTFGDDTDFGSCGVYGTDLIDIQTSGGLFASVGYDPVLELGYKVGGEFIER